MPLLELSGVTVAFGRGAERRQALADVSFALDAGALALLTGPSGAGKSTLLKLILAMERPERGTITLAGRDLHRLRRSSIPYVRRNVGVVFQDFKLLPEATPLENVALALHVLGLRRRDVLARARAVLRRVEIDPDTRRPARCLSGGEQQRVAIARALAGEPPLLLADEPTGNLDPRLGREILDLLADVCDGGTTVLVATHDPLVHAHARASRLLALAAGRLVHDSSEDAPLRASGM